jgi:hypothetical protein
VLQLAHPAAVGGADIAAAEHEACTDTYASCDGAGPSNAVSDSDEAALPPHALLKGTSPLSSGGSGSVGCVDGCSAGSGSGLGGDTAASGNSSTGIAAAQSALRTYEYHVLHSAAYGVPLLFLRGSHAGVDSIQLIASAADPDITSACACHCIRTLDCTATTGHRLSCRRAAAGAGGDSGGPAAAVPGGGAAAGRRRGRRLPHAAGQLHSPPTAIETFLNFTLLYSSTPSPHELKHVPTYLLSSPVSHMCIGTLSLASPVMCIPAQLPQRDWRSYE